MKKILYSVLALAMAAFTFTSCEDVPMPYDDPNDNNGGGTDEPTISVPTGDGTLANPFNAAAANDYVEAGQNLDQQIYIKGIVSRTVEISPSYGNATFYISDDGTTGGEEFYVYRCYSLNNQKITSEDEVKVGDEVIIYGLVTNYNGTYETVQNQAYIYSLNGDTGNGDTPSGEATGDGSLENPFNSVAANNYVSSLPAGESSTESFYIKGKISSIKENFTAQYGNASFYISDDGTSNNEFYVFRTLYLNNEKYTEGDLLQVGDEVVIYGKVVNYMGNTPETVQNESYLYSWQKTGGSTGDDIEGDTSTPNGDFETWVNGQPNNWSTSSTAGNATLSQSTDAHGGKYSVQVGGTSSANKRLGYKETELSAGEYTMTFYAKAATSAGASVRPGYVKVTDGSVGSYVYSDEYSNNITNSEWVLVTHTFTITEDGTYCVVIMNSKNPGADVLIDDFTLVCGSTVIIE